MTPTDRIAQQIAGQDPGEAYRDLVSQCFSPAEAAEIVAGCCTALQNKIIDDTDRIRDQIFTTLEVSVRLGQRRRDEINGHPKGDGWVWCGYNYAPPI